MTKEFTAREPRAPASAGADEERVEIDAGLLGDDADPFAVGKTVADTFRVSAEIGRGGMARVYEAFDLELERTVAIKVGRPGADPELLAREARLMAGFRHDGIPAIYAKGNHGGVPFLAMELLRGRTLEAYLHEQQPGETLIDEAIRIVASIADTLTVLHDAGVAHRDLKPSNVFLAPPARVVLTDFGIADLERFTPDHVAAGSPSYVAPEIVRGNARVGHARMADIYALGAVAFELLTGRPPFSSTRERVLATAAAGDRIPDPRGERPEVPPSLARLVKAMLAYEPADRPDNPADLARALRAVPLPTPGVDSASLRVLVVDDQTSIWPVISYVLEDRGYSFECVSDGEKALAAVARAPYDVVITDKNMPGLDGLALMRELRRTSPATELILMTGYSTEQAAIEAANLGVVRYLTKPFDLDDVGEAIDAAAAALRRRARRG